MTEVKFDFGEWDVESLRVSIFYPVGLGTSAQTGLWAKVTGNKPESIDSRPRERITREVGRLGENNLLLTTQDERIDWLIQPIVVPNQRVGTVLMLKNVGTTSPILRKAIRYSLETIPLVQRLAFSPVLIKQVPDPTEGLKQLSRYLPRLDLESLEGSDFIYQVNRRRRSASVPHVRVNRLARWSTEQIGGLEVQVRPSGQPRIQTAEDGFARKLLLDVNTTPESGAMSNDKVPSLFHELVTLAGELSTEGDIS